LGKGVVDFTREAGAFGEHGFVALTGEETVGLVVDPCFEL